MKAITMMYHDVCDDLASSGFNGADASIYKVSPVQFARHLDAIETVVKTSPGRVDQWDVNDPHTPLFLTFDDGGASAPAAADMLDKRGWKGHFMITTARIGTPGFVAATDIADLNQRGHMIGSHSNSHPLRMAALTPEKITEEWLISTDKLANILGVKIAVASVPGGHFSEAVAVAAEENGIKFLFNSEPVQRVRKSGNLIVLGRYTIQNHIDEKVVSGLAAGNFRAGFRQSLLWNAKKPLKFLGGDAFLRVRRWLITKRVSRSGM